MGRHTAAQATSPARRTMDTTREMTGILVVCYRDLGSVYLGVCTLDGYIVESISDDKKRV